MKIRLFCLSLNMKIFNLKKWLNFSLCRRFAYWTNGCSISLKLSLWIVFVGRLGIRYALAVRIFKSRVYCKSKSNKSNKLKKAEKIVEWKTFSSRRIRAAVCHGIVVAVRSWPTVLIRPYEWLSEMVWIISKALVVADKLCLRWGLILRLWLSHAGKSARRQSTCACRWRCHPEIEEIIYSKKTIFGKMINEVKLT